MAANPAALHMKPPPADDAGPPGGLLQRRHARIQGSQGMFCAGKKLFSESGQRRFSSCLLKRRHSKLLFQLGDGMAQAGLRDAELLCRPGVMLYVGQFDKIAQIILIHDNFPFFSILVSSCFSAFSFVLSFSVYQFP